MSNDDIKIDIMTTMYNNIKHILYWDNEKQLFNIEYEFRKMYRPTNKVIFRETIITTDIQNKVLIDLSKFIGGIDIDKYIKTKGSKKLVHIKIVRTYKYD